MKPAASAKTKIDLNGPATQVELFLLTFMAPLWGIVFPLIGLYTLFSYAGVTLIGASFFCFLHFLHLNLSHFSFQENGIRLPGVDHRLLPYTNLKRIYLERLSPLLLAVEYEYMPLKSMFSKHAAPGPTVIAELFEIQHLTEVSARQLAELFSSKLSSCEVFADVHDKLLNWHPKTAELAENKEFALMKPVLKYVVSWSKLCCKIWLISWVVVAFIAYPVCIFDMLTGSDLGSQLLAAMWAGCLHAAGLLGWLLRMMHK